MRWLRVILVAVALLGLLVVAYIGYCFWDIHRIEGMCSEIRAGTTLTEARAIVTRAGLGKYFLTLRGASAPGIFEERSGTWVIVIPAPTTVGDIACVISHDGRIVKAAKVYGP
jgi:hypothetical protein